MTEPIPVEPYNYIRNVASVSIYTGVVKFNESIQVSVEYYDSVGNFVDRIYVLLEGDDYNNWSNDDELIALVMSKLGIVPKPSS